jgi:hypothetical protein
VPDGLFVVLRGLVMFVVFVFPVLPLMTMICQAIAGTYGEYSNDECSCQFHDQSPL